jgi:hypothetical protein
MGAAAAPESQLTAIEVTFLHPENFTDAANSPSGYQLDQNLTLLRKHLIRRAPAYLAAGQKLSVVITNVDLAGGFEPRGLTMQEVRIIRGVYPPKIDLTFKLTDANGKVIKEGSRQLTDLAFDIKLRANNFDSLVYDKALLDDWLRKELR